MNFIPPCRYLHKDGKIDMSRLELLMGWVDEETWEEVLELLMRALGRAEVSEQTIQLVVLLFLANRRTLLLL